MNLHPEPSQIQSLEQTAENQSLFTKNSQIYPKQMTYAWTGR